MPKELGRAACFRGREAGARANRDATRGERAAFGYPCPGVLGAVARAGERELVAAPVLPVVAAAADLMTFRLLGV